MPMPKAPLNSRLKRLQTEKPNFLAAFELFVDEFFMELDSIYNAGDIPFLWRIYEDHIQRYETFRYPLILAEIITLANRLPSDEGDALLYHILIEPFTYAKGESQ